MNIYKCRDCKEHYDDLINETPDKCRCGNDDWVKVSRTKYAIWLDKKSKKISTKTDHKSRSLD